MERVKLIRPGLSSGNFTNAAQVSLLQIAGFLLPCFVMRRSLYILYCQRRWQGPCKKNEKIMVRDSWMNTKIERSPIPSWGSWLEETHLPALPIKLQSQSAGTQSLGVQFPPDWPKTWPIPLQNLYRKAGLYSYIVLDESD